MRTLFAPALAAAENINARSMGRLSVGAAWCAALAAIGFGWVYGVPRLQAFASTERAAPMVHVQFVDPPLWFNGEFADGLMHTAQMNLEGDPLDRDDLVDCRNALLATGWFREVRQVRRVHEDLVTIDAVFVQPYAVVRDDTGDHLVDVEGRLLARRYERGARTHFVAVTGARFPRPQQSGDVWEGADIAAALRLIAVVQQQPWRDQVVAVDIDGYVNGEPMRLRTDQGASIVWGGAPGEEPGLEVLAEGKLKRLAFMHRTYGRIDAGEANREIDLTDPRYVASRELPETPESNDS